MRWCSLSAVGHIPDSPCQIFHNMAISLTSYPTATAEKMGKLFQPSFKKSGDTLFVFFLGDIVDVGMVRAVD
jgi:hypothetical protein